MRHSGSAVFPVRTILEGSLSPLLVCSHKLSRHNSSQHTALTCRIELTPLDRVRDTHKHLHTLKNSNIFDLAISRVHSRPDHLRKNGTGWMDRVRRGGYLFVLFSRASGLMSLFFPFLYITLYFFLIDYEASLLYESDVCLLACINQSGGFVLSFSAPETCSLTMTKHW